MIVTWIDLETTGLEEEHGSILEIAIVCTDDQLNEIAEPFTSLVAPQRLFGFEVMDSFVREMHTKNGLLAELYEGPPSDLVLRPGLPHAHDVMTQAVEYVKSCVPKTPETTDEDVIKTLRGTPLAGSSVHFDRAWLRLHMPDVAKLFSHRHLDVSAFNEGAKRWASKRHGERPGLGPDGKPLPSHRALDDIRMSIATAKHYKVRVFEFSDRADYLSPNDILEIDRFRL